MIAHSLWRLKLALMRAINGRRMSMTYQAAYRLTRSVHRLSWIRDRNEWIDLRSTILDWADRNPHEASGYEEEIGFVDRYGPYVLPYEFVFDPKYRAIAIHRDRRAGHFFAMYNSRRIYFPKQWSEKKCFHYFQSVWVEQNGRSPHRYRLWDMPVNDQTVIDIGAAEGNFSVEAAEVARRVVLAEGDPLWWGALELTFAPFRSKVRLIKAFVEADNDSGGEAVSMRNLISSERPSLVKMDVEGAARDLLQSVHELLERAEGPDFVVATYHYPSESSEVKQLLEACGYRTNKSEGWMLVPFDTNQQPPYFREALIHATKSVSVP